MHSLLERISKLRILVIGDAMLDHYIWGDVHRISPEAPVPVVHVSRETWAAGGAANVALNLANLGAATTLASHVGRDEAGSRLTSILRDHRVSHVPSSGSSDAPTIIKTRVMARGQQLCRVDREESPQHYQVDLAAEGLQGLEELISGMDAVILSDYAKGVITQDLVDQLLSHGSVESCLIAIDPKPSNPIEYHGVDLLTPNRDEALVLAGLRSIHADGSYPLDLVCERIHERFAPSLLVITLGADGMAIARSGQVIERIPTFAREVFDVSGAGDAAIAALTAALAAKEAPGSAVRFANIAAGCVVAHMGTVPISFEEIRREMGKGF